MGIDRTISLEQPNEPETDAQNIRYCLPLTLGEYSLELQAANENQQRDAPGPITAAFHEALNGKLVAGNCLGVLSSNFYTQGLTPSEAIYHTVKSVSALEQARDSNFPRNRDTTKSWVDVINHLANDQEYQDAFLLNFRLPIAATVSERGKLLKGALLLNGISGPVSVLEAGCSLNHILKRLALQDTEGFKYEPTVVLPRIPASFGAPSETDPLLTNAVNRLLQDAPFKLGPSIGIDLFDVDRDVVFRIWARSNAFYMDELLVPRLTSLFDRLSEAHPPQVGFMWEDIVKFDADKLEQQVDVAYLPTMLYIINKKNPEDVSRAVENMERGVKETGFVVIQDFVDIGPDGSYRFTESRGLWSYKLWVKDMSQPESGFQEYFIAERGRANKLVLGSTLGKLSIAQKLGVIPGA